MENTNRSSEDDPINLIKKELNQFVSRELKSMQTLKQLTQHFQIKQSSKEYFSRKSFAKQAYLQFIQVQHFFQKFGVKLSAFPIVQTMSNLLNAISIQYFQVFKFSNEKWQNEYRLLEDQLSLKSILPAPKTDICSKCSQNKWHQQIKLQKHQIFNLRINDPFSYYQESILNNKEPYGEEIDHKKIQQKLSELALGVQMEQQCLSQLLQEMNQQEEQAQKNYHASTTPNQHFYLPYVPMLRSIFQHARGNKSSAKAFEEIGIQTQSWNIMHKCTGMSPEKHSEGGDDKNRNVGKLRVQLSQKSIHIKALQGKIEKIQQTHNELRLQNCMLSQQIINLQRRNSTLQMELNIIKSKPHNKVKIINKNKTIHKIKDQQSTTVNQKTPASNNPVSQNKTIHQEASMERSELTSSIKIRPNPGLLESKMKLQNNNKTMFIPNLYQALRQTATPVNFGSTFSIDRSSSKFDQQGLSSVVDFPSIRPSVYSNQIIDQKPNNNTQKKVDNSKQRPQPNMQKTVQNKGLGRFKQILRNQISNTNTIKQWTKSYNNSPQVGPKNRRKGKIQDRDTLLKMLYSQQVKENQQKYMNYDFFKKTYENFVIKIRGINEFDTSSIRMSTNHLQKKSNASIQQYFRNEASELSIQERDSISIQRKGSQFKHIRFSTCFKDIVNSIFAQGVSLQQSEDSRQKSILSKQQLAIMTQILAYMIQLKVNNFTAYIKVKTIISTESTHRQRDNQQQNKDLKNCLAIIIKSHRHCKVKQQNHNYCPHISSFVKNIIALMET